MTENKKKLLKRRLLGGASMVGDKHLKDHVSWGSFADVEKALGSVSAAITNSCAWIKDNVNRTERSVTLFNILSGALPYLDIAKQNVTGPIQLVALCTRGLFELDLRTRHILKST